MRKKRSSARSSIRRNKIAVKTKKNIRRFEGILPYFSHSIITDYDFLKKKPFMHFLFS
jgi:hypothetical protein